jgi:NCAIR mutase (PurE)-related protein
MIRELLQKVQDGGLGIEEAQEQILRMLYEQGEDFLLDLHRHRRTGFPEVVYARGKSTDQVIRIVRSFLENGGRAFISLVDDEMHRELEKAFPGARMSRAGSLVALASSEAPRENLGTAGVITAGTADTPLAGECALLLEELGAQVIRAFDFGVSGIHRPFLGIRQTLQADVLVVFAGMDGILPTMVASLTDRPVIAVPTPIGYGYGGAGETALRAMLQSCVPGLVVLNIGNSVGAAAAAVRILKAIGRQAGGKV